MGPSVLAVDQALVAVRRRMLAADAADDLSEVVRCQARLDELLDQRLRMPLPRHPSAGS